MAEIAAPAPRSPASGSGRSSASVTADGRLDDTVVDTLCDPPEEFTYGGIIAHVLTFAAHRRSLAVGALATAGITDLGAGDPRLWVA